ncbi:hypothetical protein [Burkholderia cenocepacia]|uniref:hypothetical protein n=1 Tax=Burkholderia cenocepacia TaxID=95486 RepID=UPI000F592462|nr:hypothetical protein [Burkholderia cenocepacia]
MANYDFSEKVTAAGRSHSRMVGSRNSQTREPSSSTHAAVSFFYNTLGNIFCAPHSIADAMWRMGDSFYSAAYHYHRRLDRVAAMKMRGELGSVDGCPLPEAMQMIAVSAAGGAYAALCQYMGHRIAPPPITRLLSEFAAHLAPIPNFDLTSLSRVNSELPEKDIQYSRDDDVQNRHGYTHPSGDLTRQAPTLGLPGGTSGNALHNSDGSYRIEPYSSASFTRPSQNMCVGTEHGNSTHFSIPEDEIVPLYIEVSADHMQTLYHLSTQHEAVNVDVRSHAHLGIPSPENIVDTVPAQTYAQSALAARWDRVAKRDIPTVRVARHMPVATNYGEDNTVYRSSASSANYIVPISECVSEAASEWSFGHDWFQIYSNVVNHVSRIMNAAVELGRHGIFAGADAASVPSMRQKRESAIDVIEGNVEKPSLRAEHLMNATRLAYKDALLATMWDELRRYVPNDDLSEVAHTVAEYIDTIVDEEFESKEPQQLEDSIGLLRAMAGGGDVDTPQGVGDALDIDAMVDFMMNDIDMPSLIDDAVDETLKSGMGLADKLGVVIAGSEFNKLATIVQNYDKKFNLTTMIDDQVSELLKSIPELTDSQRRPNGTMVVKLEDKMLARFTMRQIAMGEPQRESTIFNSISFDYSNVTKIYHGEGFETGVRKMSGDLQHTLLEKVSEINVDSTAQQALLDYYEHSLAMTAREFIREHGNSTHMTAVVSPLNAYLEGNYQPALISIDDMNLSGVVAFGAEGGMPQFLAISLESGGYKMIPARRKALEQDANAQKWLKRHLKFDDLNDRRIDRAFEKVIQKNVKLMGFTRRDRPYPISFQWPDDIRRELMRRHVEKMKSDIDGLIRTGEEQAIHYIFDFAEWFLQLFSPLPVSTPLGVISGLISSWVASRMIDVARFINEDSLNERQRILWQAVASGLSDQIFNIPAIAKAIKARLKAALPVSRQPTGPFPIINTMFHLGDGNFRQAKNIVGQGGTATVYRMDDEFLAKVYSRSNRGSIGAQSRSANNNAVALNRIYGPESASVVSFEGNDLMSEAVGVKMKQIPGESLTSMLRVGKIQDVQELADFLDDTQIDRISKELSQELGDLGIYNPDINWGGEIYDRVSKRIRLVDFDEAHINALEKADDGVIRAIKQPPERIADMEVKIRSDLKEFRHEATNIGRGDLVSNRLGDEFRWRGAEKLSYQGDSNGLYKVSKARPVVHRSISGVDLYGVGGINYVSIDGKYYQTFDVPDIGRSVVGANGDFIPISYNSKAGKWHADKLRLAKIEDDLGDAGICRHKRSLEDAGAKVSKVKSQMASVLAGRGESDITKAQVIEDLLAELMLKREGLVPDHVFREISNDPGLSELKGVERDRSIILKMSSSMKTGTYGPVNSMTNHLIEKARKYRITLKNISENYVNIDDMLAISALNLPSSGGGGGMVSIRQTGAHSLARLREGAAAKPHDILEKTIKLSSLAKGYGRPYADIILEKTREWGIDGLVGHWSGDGKLLGIYVTDGVRDVGASYISKIPNSKFHYVDLSSRLDFFSSSPPEALSSFRRDNPDWKRLVFTGDYDLNDMVRSRKVVPSLREGEYIDDLNLAMLTMRGGVGDGGAKLAIENNAKWNRVQHGPQYNFLAYMLSNEMPDFGDLTGVARTSARMQFIRDVRNSPVAFSPAGDGLALNDNGVWYEIRSDDQLSSFYVRKGLRMKEWSLKCG